MNPTVSDLKSHLVEGNGWTEEEFTAFAAANDDKITRDGNTSVDHDQWEYLAYMHNN